MFGGLNTAINNLGTTIISGITNSLKSLFIPSDTYFQSKFDWLKTALRDRLSLSSYEQIITSFSAVSQGKFEDVTITIMGCSGKILDGAWFGKVMNQVHDWIRGLMFILLVFYNYNQIYKLIRGTDLMGVSRTIGHMSGNDGGSDK